MKHRLIKKVHHKGILPETLKESEALCIGNEVKKVIGLYAHRAKEVNCIGDYWEMANDITEQVSVNICKESKVMTQYNGFWVLKSQMKMLNQLTKDNIKAAFINNRKEMPSRKKLRKMYDSIQQDILGMCAERKHLIRAQVIMTLQTEMNLLDVEYQMLKKVMREAKKAAVVTANRERISD